MFRLREHVNDLFFGTHWSKRAISRDLKVSRNFVSKWTRKRKMNFKEDNRGWKKTRGRKWGEEVVKRIETIYRSLIKGKDYYTGATAILQEWRKKYSSTPPPLRTIGWFMKQLGITKTNAKGSVKGASRYLCYPEHSIHHAVGKRVLEIDFIGKKFIKGKKAPIHFAAASDKYPPKLRYYQRVESETADCLMQFLRIIFKQFETPDVVKMDNGFAMNGSSPCPRVLSKLPLWLLGNKIYPMYAVPRKPFSQASIEGNNSVFGRKFWNRFVFINIRQIDTKLQGFNVASLQYHEYQPPPNIRYEDRKFVPKIFYLRQVRGDEKGRAFIEVANDKVQLRKTYINYFVLVEWNLKTERLTVFLEKENRLKKIKKIIFTLNEKSKEKIKKNFF